MVTWGNGGEVELAQNHWDCDEIARNGKEQAGREKHVQVDVHQSTVTEFSDKEKEAKLKYKMMICKGASDQSGRRDGMWCRMFRNGCYQEKRGVAAGLF